MFQCEQVRVTFLILLKQEEERRKKSFRTWGVQVEVVTSFTKGKQFEVFLYYLIDKT